VVKAFNNYKEKGFTVLGVSLDQPNAKDKWMKAIHDDNLTWTQVSDLKFWKNEVAVQYGIQAIPQNFLIDPQGKIIGKNLRGEALNKKLETLFQ
jgi:peroxiredoxin